MSLGHVRPARSQAGKQGKAWTIHYRDTDGAQKTETVHGTRRDADRALTQRLRERDTGTLATAGKQTVREYLDAWLDQCAAMRLAPQSLVRYRQACERLCDHLGHHKLVGLRASHVQECIVAMLKEGLSATNVRQHRSILNGAMRQAVRWGLIHANPVAHTDPPRIARKEVTALTKEQALALLAAARDDANGLPVIIALGTGLRAGEILGLLWSDVDTATGRIAVRRTLQNSTRQIKETKTGRVRNLVAPEFVRLALLQRRAVHDEARAADPEWNPGNLVCCTPAGTPALNMLSRVTRRLCKRADIPAVRFHDLRHTHATLLIESGENVRAVADRLGHADVSITLNVYAHTHDAVRERMARAIDEMFGG